MLPLLRGRAAWRAADDSRGPSSRDPQQALAQRFARALTLRDHQAAVAGRARGARSKNCATSKREERRRRRDLVRLAVEGAAASDPGGDAGQELAFADVDPTEVPATEEEQQLLGAIRNLQADIAQLERTALLRDSGLVSWRANRTGAALDISNEYIMQLSGGYDPCNPLRARASAHGRQFIEKLMVPDFICKDFQGVEPFLNQWEKYTIFHEDFLARLTGMRVLSDTEKRVSIYMASEFLLTFNDYTIKYLYPALDAEAQRDARTRDIVDRLIGARVRLPLDIVLHFNEHGRVFAFESRSHLHTALLETLEDPAAAMHVFCLAFMTDSGHWKLAPDPDVDRRIQRLPGSLR